MTADPSGQAGSARRFAFARWVPLRLIRARPRYFLALALMALSYWLLVPFFHMHSTRLLIAWDIGMAFFILSMFRMMYRCHAREVPKISARQDIGQRFILLLTIGAACLSFLTIAVEVRYLRQAAGWEQIGRAGLILGTILLSWCLVQVIYALHYAHHYFVRGAGEGLKFPGQGDTPLDYGDFLYFAFTIGSAFATSDVNVTSPALRRSVTAHTILSFFFNTFILGLWVNVGAGLL